MMLKDYAGNTSWKTTHIQCTEREKLLILTASKNTQHSCLTNVQATDLERSKLNSRMKRIVCYVVCSLYYLGGWRSRLIQPT